MFYTLVKKYEQNFDGKVVAVVTLKINIITTKLRANVEMKNGLKFILESFLLEENHEFEKRLAIEIYSHYRHSH